MNGTGAASRLADALADAFVRWVRDEQARLYPESPRKPDPVRSVAPMGEEEENMAVYSLYLPEFPEIDPNDPDVITRELKVLVVGEPDMTIAYPVPEPDGGYTQTFRVEQGKEATLTLVHIDDAGRRSVASDPFVFTSADETDPAQPGMLGVRATGEETDPEPAPPPAP
jgi:hypothetical protein